MTSLGIGRTPGAIRISRSLRPRGLVGSTRVSRSIRAVTLRSTISTLVRGVFGTLVAIPGTMKLALDRCLQLALSNPVVLQPLLDNLKLRFVDDFSVNTLFNQFGDELRWNSIVGQQIPNHLGCVGFSNVDQVAASKMLQLVKKNQHTILS